MKLTALLLLMSAAFYMSCTSEYDERLEEAKELRQRYLIVEETNMMEPNEELLMELEKIESEIYYLAKVSGNEVLFFKDLENY